ncbi:MAG: YajQ family cyclic di-GMP-binding protein [Ideonella sp.]|nr:YajQ family cyclic di-GMP-binding protein [Ideonella sp.]MCC7456170.1 YajQ family cyclic di-GMP-binding protein [Nitrospira sp.]
MPSFDAVVEPNRVELRNAVDQCLREIGTRFDFKGTKAAVEITDDALTLIGDSDFQLGQVRDIVLAKLAKRGVDARFVDFDAAPEKGGGDTWRQNAPIRSGIAGDDAKRLQGVIKQAKLKVQASIQGDTLRVSGARKDELQAAMAVLRKEAGALPLGFKNFRD